MPCEDFSTCCRLYVHGLYRFLHKWILCLHTQGAVPGCALAGGLCVVCSDLHKRGVGGLVRLRGVDYQVQENLSRDWGAQTHRHQFSELGLHFWVHVNHLHVATTESTPNKSKQREGGGKSNATYALSTGDLHVSNSRSAHRSYNSRGPPWINTQENPFHTQV